MVRELSPFQASGRYYHDVMIGQIHFNGVTLKSGLRSSAISTDKETNVHYNLQFTDLRNLPKIVKQAISTNGGQFFKRMIQDHTIKKTSKTGSKVLFLYNMVN